MSCLTTHPSPSTACLQRARTAGGAPETGAGVTYVRAATILLRIWVAFFSRWQRYRCGQVYEREKLVRFRPGTVLLYRMDTYHRGTVVYPDGVRRVHGVVWRRGDSDWVHAGGAGMHAGYGSFGLYAHLFPRISPYQRSVVGFPMPGSDYWTAETIAAVGERYDGVDMTPYTQARL